MGPRTLCAWLALRSPSGKLSNARWANIEQYSNRLRRTLIRADSPATPQIMRKILVASLTGADALRFVAAP
jgi:hypothetical protein